MPSLSWIERLLAGDDRAHVAEARAEIDDELADHLDAAARRYLAEGASPDDAHRRALAEFGDPTRVVVECLWIRLGGQVMLRSLTILVGVALCAIGSLLAYASLGAQRQMAEGLANLSAQLAKLHERAPVPETPPPRRAAVRGFLYLGDPSRPAKQAEAEIRRLPDGQVVWPIRTDDEGRFTVEGLAEGQYFVMAALVGQPEHRVFLSQKMKRPRLMYQVQSAPFSIDSLQEDVAIELDVRFEACEVEIELADDVVEEVAGAEGAIVNNVRYELVMPELFSLPWTAESDIPAAWQVRGRLDENPRFPFEIMVTRTWSHGQLSKERRQKFTVPAGRRLIQASQLLEVGQSKSDDPRVQRFVARRAKMRWNVYSNLNSQDRLPLDLPPNTRTKIRLSAPGRAERLAQVLFNEQATDEELMEAAAFEPMKIEILGQEPLEAAAPEQRSRDWSCPNNNVRISYSESGYFTPALAWQRLAVVPAPGARASAPVAPG